MDHIDLTDPAVRERVEYLGAHAEKSIIQDFVAQHPELLNVTPEADIENKQAIDAIMHENGLALTPENLEWAYRVAVEAGQLQFAMYHPQEIAAFDQMSTKQIGEYLKARYQAPTPPNAADLLPQFGERRWKSDEPALNEEQRAELIEKLQRERNRR